MLRVLHPYSKLPIVFERTELVELEAGTVGLAGVAGLAGSVAGLAGPGPGGQAVKL